MLVRAKDALGRYGEDVAVRVLLSAGFELLDRNWRCDAGEIDIVARDGDVLVVCEVKTRSSNAFGSPLEAVDSAKLHRLHRLAGRWLAVHDVRPARIRVDVVAVLRPRYGASRVDHLRGVA